jgi:hypothetical protein
MHFLRFAQKILEQHLWGLMRSGLSAKTTATVVLPHDQRKHTHDDSVGRKLLILNSLCPHDFWDSILQGIGRVCESG